MMINVVAVDLGVDPTRFYESVRKFVDREAKRQAAEMEKGTPDTDPPGAAAGSGELTPEHPDGIPLDEDEQQESGAFSASGLDSP